MIKVLLDNSLDKTALLFEKPHSIIEARHAAEVPSALLKIEAELAKGHYVAGFFSYELGYALEERLQSLMPQGRKLPLLWFGVFDAPQKFEGDDTSQWLKKQGSAPFSLTNFTPDLNKKAYAERFKKVKHHIQEGDLYQLNLTFKSRFSFTGSAVSLYQSMRQQQPVRYGAMIQTGEFDILSASPELFLSLENNALTTIPMKGTVRRGRWAEEDFNLKNWLATDKKSRAENLMIVDLMRNDIGRISKIGSVQVTDMFDIKTFPSLHQMTTDIHATLKDGLSLSDFVASIFPAGSITGAPKMRAQELIHELEVAPREVYTGSIGFFKPEDRGRFSAHFNVAIRTLTLQNGAGEIGIGSGVVYDSNCEDEYEECFLKMRFLTDPQPDFCLFETLLWDGEKQEYALFNEHLERLETSAARFGFAYSRQNAAKTLQNAAKGRQNAAKIKLRLFKDGTFDFEGENFAVQPPSSPWKFALAEERVNSADPFLYHKTSFRTFFDTARAKYVDSGRCDEIVFLNERGELTEGSYTNLFIEKDGVLWTPKQACGLLPGTLRAHLLATGAAREAILSPTDLATADAIFLGNSVRGLVLSKFLRVA